MNKTIRTMIFASATVLMAACGNGRKADNAGASAQVEERTTLISTTVATRQEVPQTEIYSSSVNSIFPPSPIVLKVKINSRPANFSKIAGATVRISSFAKKSARHSIMSASS